MPRPERGAAFLKTIVFLAVFAVFIFVGVKTVPVYFNNSQFSDYIRDRAARAAVERSSPEVVQADVIHFARRLELPLTQDDVHVTTTRDTVSIEVEYVVPVDLRLFTWSPRFALSAESRSN
jgi:hypothetical protein